MFICSPIFVMTGDHAKALCDIKSLYAIHLR